MRRPETLPKCMNTANKIYQYMACRVPCAVCRVPSAVCHVMYAVCRMPCVVCRVPCVVCRVLCAVCRVLCHDTTRHDTTRHDTTRHDTTRHDTTRHDTTRHDTTRHVIIVVVKQCTGTYRATGQSYLLHVDLAYLPIVVFVRDLNGRLFAAVFLAETLG